MHSSDIPQFCLKLNASTSLALTLPFTIYFTIEQQDSVAGQTVIIEWNPDVHRFVESGFVLLRHTATDLKVMAVEHSGSVDVSRHEPLLVDGWDYSLRELEATGVDFQSSLPGTYQKLFRAYETYTLIWPGGEVAKCEKGTVRQHIRSALHNRPDPLILPGGPHIAFSTHEAMPPWPRRAEREAKRGFDRANGEEEAWRFEQTRMKPESPPESHTKPDPNAPNLRVSLQCPSTLRTDDIAEVTVKVTYEAHATARPITFHTYIFEAYGVYRSGRLRNGTWKAYENESTVCGGSGPFDEPDARVNVGKDDRFTSLHPDETWMTTQRIGKYWAELPRDVQPGETCGYVFHGTTLDWWDEDPKEDHKETAVKLPYLTGRIVEPRDNDDRPQLALRTSNVVEFIVTD